MKEEDQSLVSVNSIAVTYKRRRGLFSSTETEVLRDISFDLRRGESLGILGRNGAGKSTLLRLLAGVIAPDKGEIKYKDNILVSMLALQAGFEGELSGRDNILLNGLLMGAEKHQILSSMDSIIEFAELESAIEKPVKTYSSGMRARLGFSIAYRLQSDVLLVDEVLGVGDARFREKSGLAMREKLKSNQTIVLVSHSAEAIKQLCTRALWIEGGVVMESGDPVEVVRHYERFISTSDSD